jgi:hypothetical protein
MASNQARFEKLINSVNSRFDKAARKWQPGGTEDWHAEMSDILYSGHAGAWRIGADQAGGKKQSAAASTLKEFHGLSSPVLVQGYRSPSVRGSARLRRLP